MHEQHVRYYSHHLGRDLDLLVFGHSGYPLVLFPTSQGRYYENKDFKLLEAVHFFLDSGRVKIYCPDSVDAESWYNRSVHPADRARNHGRYDAFLNDELAPYMMQQTGQAKIVAAGCSFGGYHAANFAFKHPEKVSHLFSMSGAFDIRDQADGFYNEDVFYNNPVDFLPGAHHPDLWQMKIILGTSDWDICLDANYKLSTILNQKNIPHWLDIRHGEHDWPLWRDMFPHYLSLI